jgi:hypothetical protein
MGLVALLALVGIQVEPQQADLIVQVGLFLGGLFGVFTPEK